MAGPALDADSRTHSWLIISNQHTSGRIQADYAVSVASSAFSHMRLEGPPLRDGERCAEVRPSARALPQPAPSAKDTSRGGGGALHGPASMASDGATWRLRHLAWVIVFILVAPGVAPVVVVDSTLPDAAALDAYLNPGAEAVGARRRLLQVFLGSFLVRDGESALVTGAPTNEGL